MSSVVPKQLYVLMTLFFYIVVVTMDNLLVLKVGSLNIHVNCIDNQKQTIRQSKKEYRLILFLITQILYYCEVRSLVPPISTRSSSTVCCKECFHVRFLFSSNNHLSHKQKDLGIRGLKSRSQLWIPTNFLFDLLFVNLIIFTNKD